MISYNLFALFAFAFRYGCSFFGGRPASDVLRGVNGELVFMFRPGKFGNLFFQWIRWNHDCDLYEERELNWRGQTYQAIFLKTYYKIPEKFLFSFRNFFRYGKHKVTLFN